MTKLDEMVNDLANTLREGVTALEASAPTTRGNYGLYMAVFSRFADDVGQARILAMALKKAGANVQGVDDAFKVTYGCL